MRKFFNRAVQPDKVRPPSSGTHFACGNNISLLNKRKKMDWLKTNFRQGLILAVIVALMSLGSSFMFRGWTAKDDKINGAASVELVEKKQTEMKCYVNEQDQVLQKQITHIDGEVQLKTDKEDFEKLYQETKDNNKLLIEILREVRK
jgi:hypothetical protein